MLRTVIGLAAGFCGTVVALSIICIVNSEKPLDLLSAQKVVAESTVFEELVGQYGDYRIDGYSVSKGMVFVVVSAHEPQRYIKALQDALKMVEEKTGKKVVRMDVNGCPARAYLSLGDRPME